MLILAVAVIVAFVFAVTLLDIVTVRRRDRRRRQAAGLELIGEYGYRVSPRA